MTATVVDRINEAYPRLSPSHRRVAQFVLASYEEAALLTSEALGARVRTSEATVIRFAQELGFKGYPDLRAALGRLLTERTSHADRMTDALARLRVANGPLQQVLAQDIRALHELERTCSPALLESVAREIRRARTVYVMGLGVSRSLAAFLDFRLRRMALRVETVLYGGSEAWERLAAMARGDLLFAIGFFRGYRDLQTALREARRRRARTVVLTDTPRSPLASDADVLLVGRRGDLTVINSLVVPMALLNMLTVAVALQDAPRAIGALRAWDELRDEFERDGENPARLPPKRTPATSTANGKARKQRGTRFWLPGGDRE
jgi:DNA-binding MurR/RpiR family transcriptional regulator